MGDIKWEGGETATAQLTSIIPTLVAGPRFKVSQCTGVGGLLWQDAQPQRMQSNVKLSRLQAARCTTYIARRTRLRGGAASDNKVLTKEVAEKGLSRRRIHHHQARRSASAGSPLSCGIRFI